MTTQLDFQKRAELLSAAREALSALLHTLQAEVDTVKQGRMPAIRLAARKVAAEHNRLRELIEAHPDMFKSPRSYVVAGLKYGLKKSPGRMSWPCDAQLEKLRDDFARETDPAKQKAIAEAVQVRVIEYTPEIPVGEYLQPAAMRKNVKGYLSSPVAVFWNVGFVK